MFKHLFAFLSRFVPRRDHDLTYHFLGQDHRVGMLMTRREAENVCRELNRISNTGYKTKRV